MLGSQVETTQKPPRSAKATVTALRVKLIVDHGGLAAGSVIEIGSVSTAASAAPTTVAPTKPTAPTPPTPTARPVIPPDAPREPGTSIPGGAPAELVRPAPAVTAQLTSGGYVFPVFGPASFGDTFGAARADVSGGWHHGEDIFAPLGTPLLAVADGTVFSVGWNDIGGWRVWLRDRAGNEFYYAHLSAYSPLAVNGRQVKAGDVLGFMGKTGDAEFSPRISTSRSTRCRCSRWATTALSPRTRSSTRGAGPRTCRSTPAARTCRSTGLRLRARVSRPPAGACCSRQTTSRARAASCPGALESTLAGRAPKSPAGGQDRVGS